MDDKIYPKLARTLLHVNLSVLNNAGMQEFMEEYLYSGLLCAMQIDFYICSLKIVNVFHIPDFPEREIHPKT